MKLIHVLIGCILTQFVIAQTTNEYQKILATDGAVSDMFGNSVYIDGNYAIIGSPSDDDYGSASGSAYIFFNNAGTWMQMSKLTASDAAADDYFGVSVGIDGNYAIIGAWGDDDMGDKAGAAYIFYNNAGTWTQVQKLTASDGTINDYFGITVSISGDYAVVGVYNDDDLGISSGSVYIFHNNAGNWQQYQKINAYDGATGDYFGRSVSISGDHLIVGADYDDDNGGDSGSAYIFYNNAGTWTHQAKVKAYDGAVDDRFGYSVDISGDYVIAGSMNDDENGSNSGSAYIYYFNGTSWVFDAKILASDGSYEDCFGRTVSISGNYALVGSYRDNDSGSESGSAYLYYYYGGTWQQQAKHKASDATGYDNFGNAVSISDSYSIIGAYHEGGNGYQSGSAYIFGPPQLLTQPAQSSVCNGGDVNIDFDGTGISLCQWQVSTDGGASYNDITDGSIYSGTETNMLTVYADLSMDNYLYRCMVSGFGDDSTASAELWVVDLTLDIGDERICGGNSVQMTTNCVSNYPSESGTFSYTWNPATGLDNINIPNPNANPGVTTIYFLTVTDQLGCSVSGSAEVLVQKPYHNQQLCLVSVDPTVGKNKIMWEKVPDVGTESYLIQKEIATNVYSVIGIVPAADTSYYIDYGSNPEAHGDKYKVTVMDTCLDQSEIDSCAYHKTINLVIAAFGSTMGLSWDYYEVEDGSFVPDKYYIYRGTTPFNLQLLDSVSGSFNSYNDINVYNVYYYMVGAMKQSPCDLNVQGQPVLIDSLFSNKKDNNGLVGIYKNKGWKPLSIYPNPASETVTIEFPNQENESYTIFITDITGKQICNTNKEKFICRAGRQSVALDVSDYVPGIYYIEICGHKNYKGKLIVY
ncbi:MAG: T9SS type A sorting domain-containing protein [Bacteroidota bacterium]